MSMPMSLPLPPNWTEHRAPNGQLYYHNPRTKESTYIRPLPLPIPQQPPKKKEKLVEKIQIPGTEWLRVATAKGDVFWNHRETKKSVWVVPEEIREQVQEWERSKEAPAPEAESQVQDDANGKRKATEEPKEGKESKKARVEDEDEAKSEDEDEEQRAVLEEMAAAAEDDAPSNPMEEDEEEDEKTETQTEPVPEGLSLQELKILFRTLLEEKGINPLQPWDTSLPLIIRDPRYTSLPSLNLRKEVFDEYCRERARELRMQKAKAQAQAQAQAQTSLGIAATSRELTPETKESYLAFLKATVTSTRMNFTEFRRAHKKDRKFYCFGRDDREREKVFKEWLKELGEIKRAAAKVAEQNFFKLLEELVKDPEPNANWKEVKKDKVLTSDQRYDAVGSSSLRQELFEVYLARAKNNSSGGALTNEPKQFISIDDNAEKEKEKELKRQKALADRQSQVQAQKQQLAHSIDRSRAGLERGGSEEAFRSLLTDAIRDPLTTWSDSLSHLSTDPRYTNSPLPIHSRQRLFNAHLDLLRQKHIVSLHGLFTAHSNSIQPLGLGLDARFSSLPPEFMRSIEASLPVTKLQFSRSAIEREFEKWQVERYNTARREFDELLSENNFLEFWGKAGKSAITSEAVGRGMKGREEVDGKGMDVKIGNEDLAGEVEEEDEPAKNMREMAKNIDVGEVERVLKIDKRYRIFDYIPQQREQWLRDYMQSMAAPKLSVHIA